MSKLKRSGKHYLVDKVSFPNTIMQELDNNGVVDVDVMLVDKRSITREQQKLVYALLQDFTNYTGQQSDNVKDTIKKTLGIKSIAISVCTMTQAREFIETLIGLMIDLDVPLIETLKEQEFKFSKWHARKLLEQRKCFVTGKTGANIHLHHLDTVGAGNNRNTVSHLGKRVLMLRYDFHTEAHAIGNDEFIKKYHLQEMIITLDEELCKKLKLKF